MPYSDLDEIRTISEVEIDNDDGSYSWLPVGARGTIVGVWSGGKAYEVEFEEGLATLTEDRFELLSADPSTDHAASL